MKDPDISLIIEDLDSEVASYIHGPTITYR